MKLIFGFFDFLILSTVQGTPLTKGSSVIEGSPVIKGSPVIEGSTVIEGSPVIDSNDVQAEVNPPQKKYNGNTNPYYGRWRTTQQCSYSNARKCHWDKEDLNIGDFRDRYGTIIIPKAGYYSIDASLINEKRDKWIGCKLWIWNGGKWFRGAGS